MPPSERGVPRRLSLSLPLTSGAPTPNQWCAWDAVRVSHSLRVLSSPPERKRVGESELTYLTTCSGRWGGGRSMTGGEAGGRRAGRRAAGGEAAGGRGGGLGDGTLISELGGWPSSMVGSASGLLTSYSRSTPSLPPVTMCALSADQSAARTILRCLSSKSSSPVRASHTCHTDHAWARPQWPAASGRARAVHLGSVVGRAGDGTRRGAVERGPPDRTLVTLEGADPVAGLPGADHCSLVVASGDEEDAVLGHVAELNARHGPRVPRADERSCLRWQRGGDWRFRHRTRTRRRRSERGRSLCAASRAVRRGGRQITRDATSKIRDTYLILSATQQSYLILSATSEVVGEEERITPHPLPSAGRRRDGLCHGLLAVERHSRSLRQHPRAPHAYFAAPVRGRRAV